jgi:uncharacterized protein YjbI with pentapeptide repeats
MANLEHLEILQQGVEAWNQWRSMNIDIRPDLSRAELRKVNPRKVNLTVNFGIRSIIFPDGVDFSGINLNGAELTGVDCSTDILSGADFSGADLTGVILDMADCSRANFSGADLHHADLTTSVFSHTTFAEAKLRRANLTGSGSVHMTQDTCGKQVLPTSPSCNFARFVAVLFADYLA